MFTVAGDDRKFPANAILCPVGHASVAIRIDMTLDKEMGLWRIPDYPFFPSHLPRLAVGTRHHWSDIADLKSQMQFYHQTLHKYFILLCYFIVDRVTTYRRNAIELRAPPL